jgi:AraC family transcriptional regulator
MGTESGRKSEWNMNVQRIIDLVERNLRGELTLEDVSRRLGYSSWYCTRQFTRIVGMSLRSYLRLRRLSEAVIALRETDRRILDVAVEFGFSSQEAFSRAFRDAWGCSPGAWRNERRPLALILRRYACSSIPEGERTMKNVRKIGEIGVSVQSVPACRFIGIRVDGATDYLDMWGKLQARGTDCPTVEGLLTSISANAQIGGWYGKEGKGGYLYGVELPADYAGPVPQGMEAMDIPASDYLVFHHPPYDFASQDRQVWEALGKAVAAFDPGSAGYRWNFGIPTWQRHDAAGMGQAWCRPITKA